MYVLVLIIAYFVQGFFLLWGLAGLWAFIKSVKDKTYNWGMLGFPLMVFVGYLIVYPLNDWSKAKQAEQAEIQPAQVVKASNFTPPTSSNSIPSLLSNPDHILNLVQENGIRRQLLEISSLKNGAQIGIVLVRRNPTNKPIEDVAREIMQKENVGGKTKGRGMLFYLDQSKKEFRIEVSKDLEGEFTDGYLGSLGRDFIQPALDTNSYYFPLTKLLNNINNTLQTGKKGFTEENIQRNTETPKPTGKINQPEVSFFSEEYWQGLHWWQKLLILILGLPTVTAVALGAGVTIRK